MYALLAMAIIALIAFTVSTSTRRSDQRMTFNEVSTQASGVAVDVIEHISRLPFDVATDTSKVSVWPPVSSPAALTPAANFGGCVSYNTCESIEEFHGFAFPVVRDNFRYDVSVDVAYVDEDNPSVYSANQTYAKQVTVSVASPHMNIGNGPLTLQMRRVITYDKVTNP